MGSCARSSGRGMRARMDDRPATRVREPQRIGQEILFVIAEDSLPPDHPARLLWTALGDFDLTGFTDTAKAVDGQAGRRVYSPRMMLTLWGYALYDGVVHARKIARLIRRDVTYRWIVGDILVERSAIAAFLADHRAALVDLLADVLGALTAAQLLFLPTHRLAQDGTRGVADAARGSFRTADGLAACRDAAAAHLAAVLADADDPQASARAQAAAVRGARAVVARVEAATAAVKEVQAQRAAAATRRPGKTAATASTTDPDARLMKMPDGGYRPAYNLQFATVGDPAGGPLAIVGVQVTNQGTDKASLTPMRDQVMVQTGVLPVQVLVDAEHLTLDDLRQADQTVLDIVSTVPEHWSPDGRDQDAVTRAWMARM